MVSKATATTPFSWPRRLCETSPLVMSTITAVPSLPQDTMRVASNWSCRTIVSCALIFLMMVLVSSHHTKIFPSWVPLTTSRKPYATAVTPLSCPRSRCLLFTPLNVSVPAGMLQTHSSSAPPLTNHVGPRSDVTDFLCPQRPQERAIHAVPDVDLLIRGTAHDLLVVDGDADDQASWP